MYSVSADYLNKINGSIRETSLRGTLKIGELTLVLTELDIAPGSFSYNNQCVSGSDMDLGSVMAAEAKLSIYDNVTDLNLEGARLFIEAGLLISPGVYEYAPVGTFNVVSAIHKLTVINLTALDDMIKLDVAIPSDMTGTPDQLLDVIATETGVDVANSSVATFPNGTDIVIVTLTDSLKTYRDLLMWLAEYLASYAILDRTGKIWLRRVYQASTMTIPPLVRFKSPSLSDVSMKITAITAGFSSSLFVHSLALPTNDGSVFQYDDNPLFWSLSDEAAEIRLINILNELNTAQYSVCKGVEFNGNPAIDVGDYITLSDTVRGNVLIRVTSIKWKSKGKSTLIAAGLSNQLKVKSTTDAKVASSRTEAKIDKVKQEIVLVVSSVESVGQNASDALSAANTAQARADLAVTNAATAQSAANAAQGTANTANSAASTATGLLADLASDSKLTAVEKQQVKTEWDAIVSEKAINDTQATAFAITTEKTNYGTSYSALSTYITPLLASLIVTSDIVGTTFRATFKDYYDKRQLLLNAIASKSKTLADAAQGTANTAVTNAATAQTQANLGVANAALAQTKANQGVADAATAKTQADLGVANAALAQTKANQGVADALTAHNLADTAITNAATAQTQANTATTNAAAANTLLTDLASDSKLTAVEKQMVKKEWDGIVSEKVLNDTQATNFGITTEKTAYGTSYTTLSTYITPLLTDLTTTSDIVGTTFRANFKDYYDKLTTLLNAIAVKAKTLADTAQTQANTATTNAATAKTQADLGVANAATAQTQADQGVADASAAQASANAANASSAGLTTRVQAAEQKLTPQAITQTVEDTSALLAKKSYVDQTAGAFALAIGETIRDEYGNTISNVQGNFIFTSGGLEIKMSGAEFSTFYAANRIEFRQNGNVLQWLSGNKNYMTDLIIVGNLALPKHKFETLANGHTVLRYIGG